jgi:2-polyprenyl-3-methyl-5-hydroxy-6-metoxy-1,4-benzoquinol methylase
MMDLSGYPLLNRIVTRQLELWPQHSEYLSKSFQDRPEDVLAVCEKACSLMLRLADRLSTGLDGLCEDYRYLCTEIVLPEELFFRRHNRYRLSSFEDANRECYSNTQMMNRYMNGLLLSYVLWDNHSRAVAHYVKSYISTLPDRSDHLEIGPGHGLLLYFAASDPRVGSVSAWDIAPASITNTKAALEAMGVSRPVTLTLRNLFDFDPHSDAQRFDSIIMSEILEHLEDPTAALRAAHNWLRPGGTIWINVPANSPAPDHLFLVNSFEHACELVEAAGLKVVDSAAYPMSGTTLEKARKRRLAVSCVVTGRRES